MAASPTWLSRCGSASSREPRAHGARVGGEFLAPDAGAAHFHQPGHVWPRAARWTSGTGAACRQPPGELGAAASSGEVNEVRQGARVGPAVIEIGEPPRALPATALPTLAKRRCRLTNNFRFLVFTALPASLCAAAACAAIYTRVRLYGLRGASHCPLGTLRLALALDAGQSGCAGWWPTRHVCRVIARLTIVATAL